MEQWVLFNGDPTGCWELQLVYWQYRLLCVHEWYRTLILKVWYLDLQHQHHLGTCLKCKLFGPTLDLLNQKFWELGQQSVFYKTSTCFWYTLKYKKHHPNSYEHSPSGLCNCPSNRTCIKDGDVCDTQASLVWVIICSNKPI